MDVNITRVSPILVKAVVNVPWEKVSDRYTAALKEVSSLAQIPGFRKGKAPAAILKKRFHNQIAAEVAQKFLPTNMQEWIEGENLKAVGTPRLQNMELKEKDTFHYEAEVDVLPDIELKDWKGIEAEALKVETTDEAIQQELESLIARASQPEAVGDRPAQKGDHVKMAITAIDGEKNETLTDLDSYELDLDDETHPLFFELIDGLKTGESASDEKDVPDDAPFEEWRGKKLKFYIDVNEITTTKKCQLDDEFAATQGVETMETLRENTKKRMHEDAERGEKQRLESSLLEKLIKEYDFEVPRDLIYSEAKALAEQQIMPYFQLFQNADKKMQQDLFQRMLQGAIPQAHAKVRIDLVLDEIAKAENMQVDPAELDEELEKHKEAFQVETIEALKEKIAAEDPEFNGVKTIILRRRTIQAIRDAAKITVVDALTVEEHDHEHDHSHEHKPEAAVVEENAASDSNPETETQSAVTEQAEEPQSKDRDSDEN